ncbi:MAG: hypothetical protein RMJ87_10450 [Cytophagales bacterium]|nr:GPI anchored serine-threonine rich family protein [Bernardetiaceae bacterium]MDW8205440.1 hypothetical protein [Cytophagales bacterium]
MKKKLFVLACGMLVSSYTLFANAAVPYPRHAADTLKTIRIEQPQSVIFTGKEQIITWSCNFNDTVQIDLYKSELFYATIEYRVPSRKGLNSYAWSVPANFPKGGGYRLVIRSISDVDVNGKSNLLTIKSDSKSKRKFIWIAGGLVLAAGLAFLGIQLAKPKTKALPEPPLPEGQ